MIPTDPFAPSRALVRPRPVFHTAGVPPNPQELAPYGPLPTATPVHPVSPFASAAVNSGFPGGAVAAKPATAAAGPPASGAPGPGGIPVDYLADPILAKVRALNAKLIADAETAALAGKKQALIQFGDPNIANQTINDSATAKAAEQNPFSTIALLLQGHNLQDLGINEVRNKQNLFYSSTRGNDLGQEGQAYLGRQASAHQSLMNQLQGYDQQVLAAQNQAAEQLVQAEDAAYGRALQMALQYGYGGTAGGSAQSEVQSATGGPTLSQFGSGFAPQADPRQQAYLAWARQQNMFSY